jgi:hypothetical protein
MLLVSPMRMIFNRFINNYSCPLALLVNEEVRDSDRRPACLPVPCLPEMTAMVNENESGSCTKDLQSNWNRPKESPMS